MSWIQTGTCPRCGAPIYAPSTVSLVHLEKDTGQQVQMTMRTVLNSEKQRRRNENN